MRWRETIVALCLATLTWLPKAGAAELFGIGSNENKDAKVQVEFTGVEGPLLENVRALSSLHRLSTPRNSTQRSVGRLAQRAPGEARTALRPFGYYEPKVETGLTEADGNWKVSVAIDPGSPVTLVEQQFDITGPGREEKFLPRHYARSQLKTGERLSHLAYDQLKGDLLRTALGNGYLDAEFTSAELLVDPAARTARARVTLETGERYRFGPTIIEQSSLREGLVRRYLRYKEGDWYNAEALLRTQFALDDSQYFSLVEVLPEERDRERKTAAVRITSESNRRHLYTIAAGYGTDTGARGTLGWEDRRFNRAGHRVRAQIRASDIESSVGVAYIIPWTDPALEKLSFELRGFDEQHGDVETSGTTFKVGLTQVRGGWQRVLSVTADKTEDTVTTSSGGSTLVDRNRQTLLVPGITYARLPPDFLGVNAIPRGFQVELLASTETARIRHQFHARRRQRRAALPADGQVGGPGPRRNRRERGRRVRGIACGLSILCRRRPERPRLRL